MAWYDWFQKMMHTSHKMVIDDYVFDAVLLDVRADYNFNSYEMCGFSSAQKYIAPEMSYTDLTLKFRLYGSGPVRRSEDRPIEQIEPSRKSASYMIGPQGPIDVEVVDDEP